MQEKAPRAPRNRTLVLTPEERTSLLKRLNYPAFPLTLSEIQDQLFTGDMVQIAPLLPEGFADLIFLDPPYNMGKEFHGTKFAKRSDEDYMAYLKSWFPLVMRALKPDGTVYLCGDWQCSAADFLVMKEFLTVRGRIVWEREKGRGALRNWKNCTEDIWYGTKSDNYCFNLNAVKLRKQVIAPYKSDGKPRDWQETDEGKFRDTCPSNFWDDITVPYWSMPENTDHPTQKPEKLLAKLILASSKPGDVIFDPFSGSGTTAVTAKKLGRHYTGIEIDPEYSMWALKRLDRAETDKTVQGYENGIFYDRNYKQKAK